jgi:type IV pilus assembly protein PilA
MRRRNRQRGFTLIELLIVVTIIGIILAIALPKFTKTQIQPNEMSAIKSLQTIFTAELMYSNSHSDQGFSPDLASLGGVTGEIGQDLASGHKSGYTFTYTPGEKINGLVRSFTITAVPDQVGTTGQRRFYLDESGQVRQNSSGPADPNSPAI